MDRRTFFSVTGRAGVGVGTLAAACSPGERAGVSQKLAGNKPALMKVGTQRSPTSDHLLDYFKRHGVNHICGYPPDPGVPAEGFQGVDRVLGTVEGLKKFVSIRENPYHGLNLCVGTTAYCNVDAPVYVARDFDRMVRETKPDAVIITTPDSFHVPYAIRTLELGADAISEKPLATDAGQCQALREAEIRTGKTVFTTF